VSYIAHGDDPVEADTAAAGVPVMQPSVAAVDHMLAAFAPSPARESGEAVATS